MATTPKPPLDALAVAYLASDRRMTQKDIAKILEMNQSTVSRLFKRVKDEYIKLSFCREKVDDATMQKIVNRASPPKLAGELQRFAENHELKGVPHVDVVPMESGLDVEEQMLVFALGAAVVVKRLLNSVDATVGVAWGRTIWHIAKALRDLPPRGPWREHNPIEFVPLCGDPLDVSSEKYRDITSSRIASDLSRSINGDNVHPAWLGLVPAFVPKGFEHGAARTIIDRLINLVPEYRRIFGLRGSTQPTDEHRAMNLDMILAATGTADNPLGFGKGRLAGLSLRESQVLAENIHGDIGGVLVPKLSAGGGVHKTVLRLMSRWTGLKMAHLEECAERAFENRKQVPRGGEGLRRPGVVLLSFGPARASIVSEAVRRGLANHLIIDSRLESSLLEHLSAVARRG
jgi:DNA-binding transcriptional regulator LsrR (DeoR family)